MCKETFDLHELILCVSEGCFCHRSNDTIELIDIQVYKIQDKMFVFTPQSFDRMVNYIDTDPSLAMSTLAYGLNYLATTWSDPGRPTLTLILHRAMLEDGLVPPPFINTLRKLRR